MKKTDEVEVKIAAEDAASVRKRLREAGFRTVRPRVFEANIVLDDGDSTLLKRGLLLRVRSAGKVITCTFKGEGKPGIHKRREERQFHADDLDECLAVFEGLGYRQSLRYEKYRTEFQRPDDAGVAMLDETPIGVFLELEGPSRWIDRAAKELGYSRADYILASYGRLYSDWCAEYGIDSRDMKFS